MPPVAPRIRVPLPGGGAVEGSPAEIPAKALHKYGTKFRQQAKECNKREGRDDIIERFKAQLGPLLLGH